MKAQRYLRYLPDFVAEYAEFQKLGEIEGEIAEHDTYEYNIWNIRELD